jgi:hypothetical protein
MVLSVVAFSILMNSAVGIIAQLSLGATCAGEENPMDERCLCSFGFLQLIRLLLLGSFPLPFLPLSDLW